MNRPRIVAWRVGKDWSKWHVMIESGVPWCGRELPSHASICELESNPLILLGDLCKPCLIAYAMSEAE